MTERVVRVTVTAFVNSYLAGMDQVAKKSRESADEAEKLQKRVEAQEKAFNIAGKSMLVAGGVIAAGLAFATYRAAQFDQAMSNVQAATMESADNMSALRQAALDAGASTVYTAQESAGAIEELAKAGLSTKDILGGGLTGALNLAAAGNMAVADAAGVASTTLQQFQLKGDQASKVADLLAAGAGKAMGDVSDLSMALSQSGTVAAQFGLSVEETVGSLAAFASAGLLGSDAGTSFRTMLLRLANPTGEAAQKMKDLGIQAYDAQGNFIGMSGLAGQLQKGLSDLTQEQRNASLAIIFGQDAIRAANILYQQGAKGISDWTSKVNDAGYAAKTAEIRLNNLAGDLEELGGAFDTAFIGVGSNAQGPLRGLVQGITDLVNGFNGLPEGGQAAVMWVGAVGSAVLVTGGLALLAIPKIAAFKVAMTDLGITGAGVRSRLGTLTEFLGGPYGIALAVGTAAILTFNKAIEEGVPAQAEITNAIKTSATAAAGLEAAFSRGSLEKNLFGDYADQLKDLPGLLDRATSAGWRWADLTFNEQGALDSIKRYGDGLAELAATDMPRAQEAFANLADSYGLNSKQTAQLLKEMPAYRDAILGLAGDQGVAADSAQFLAIATGKNESATKSASDAYQEQATQVQGVRQALSDLLSQINSQNSIQQQAVQANATWLEGLAGVSGEVQRQRDEFEQLNGTLDGFVLSLDESTAAGAGNASMLSSLAADAIAAADAQFQVDQTTMSADDAAQKYAGTLAAQRQAFIDSAIQAGFNADEVQRLADRVFAVPDAKTVQIIADTARANAAMDELVRTYDGREIRLQLSTNQVVVGDRVFGGLRDGRAAGGMIPGAPSNVDNVLVPLATGEFVVRASQVAIPENRRALEYINSGGRMRGYAAGGFVQPTYATSRSYSTSSSTVTIAPVIYAAPGMDENAIVDKAVRRVQEVLR